MWSALPRVVRWVVASAPCAQSLILVAAHANDVRLAVGTLWQRRLALSWMIRLDDAGVPVTWVWTLGTYVLPALAVAFIRLAPGLRLTQVLTTAYSLARKTKLLQRSWFRRTFVSSYFLYKRFCEDSFSELVDRKPQLFCNGDILDIGANIGYTSCLFSKALRPESKVYCFEPDQFNFDLLLEVIRRKKLSGRVVPVHAAMGASDGHVELWHNERHHGDHRVVTEHFKSTRPDLAGTCTVPMMTIDSYVRSHNLRNISFIKIDVQGYELAVCEGMKETLAAFPDTNVCFEYAPGALVELGFEPIRLLDFFTARAYLIHILSGRGIRLVRHYGIIHQAVGTGGYIDLICSRRELV